MEQTKKYIEVLNWGYGGFSPMALSPDFESSYKQAKERLQLLGSLDYDRLLDEAISPEGKAYLEKYSKTETTFKYRLHFMRDREQLLEALQPDYWEKEGEKVVLKKNPKRMIRPYLDMIDKYRDDGIWTFEQWRECRFALSEIERRFEERLKQFAVAYNNIGIAELPEPQQEQQPESTLKIKRLGRKPTSFKQCILVPNIDEYEKKIIDLMKDKDWNGAKTILKNLINSEKIKKPSHNAFTEAFPHIKVPKSTYNSYFKGIY